MSIDYLTWLLNLIEHFFHDLCRYISQKLKPCVRTEHQLIFLCHVFGPFLQRIDIEKHNGVASLAILLYEMLEVVDKQHGPAPLEYLDPICDFLYHIKYIYVGNKIRNECEAIIKRLRPALQMRLRFISHLTVEDKHIDNKPPENVQQQQQQQMQNVNLNTQMAQQQQQQSAPPTNFANNSMQQQNFGTMTNQQQQQLQQGSMQNMANNPSQQQGNQNAPQMSGMPGQQQQAVQMTQQQMQQQLQMQQHLMQQQQQQQQGGQMRH